MIQYTCDVCGTPMPEGYTRPKQKTGQLADACRVYDVCDACAAAGRQIDVPGLLLAAWREAVRPGTPPAEENFPSEPPLLREHSVGGKVLTGRGSTEKAEILDRLRHYRKEHGLGCLAAVAQRAGEGITDDTLRGLLSGDLALGIKDWRRIGRALDKLGTDQGEKKEA